MTDQPDEVLPDVTSDEKATGWGDRPVDEEEDLRRLLDERPPHHDRE